MSRPFGNEDAFRAVADGHRRRILDLLAKGPKSVNDLADEFELSLATISHHLRQLRTAGLIQQRRAGRQRIYRLNAHPLRPIAQWLFAHDRLLRDSALSRNTTRRK